jgi:alpha-amylase
MNSTQNDERRYLNLYFQVHQPRRLGKFQFFDVGSATPYFDDGLNKQILCRIADECYLPANQILLDLIKKFPQVRATFSISGVALEQFQLYAPAVIKSFRQLAETGCVEFLAETYYHSLSYFIDREEFIEQVKFHRQKVYELIGFWPKVARNTELIYSDDIGETFADLKFRGVFIDGIQPVLNGKTTNALYRHPSKPLILFPRNFQLSDDIAFRYSDRSWSEWPLTPDKFSGWLRSIPSNEKFVCLGMDYETFGEHKKASTGIFDFLRNWITMVIQEGRFTFATPSEIIGQVSVPEVITTTKAISWADESRDLSAWLGNNMQRDAFDSLYKFHATVMDSENETLINIYRNLQTSDHFYYMSTKQGQDGNVHQYFSPYSSPYEAFMNYMNVVADLELRLRRLEPEIDGRQNRHPIAFVKV